MPSTVSHCGQNFLLLFCCQFRTGSQLTFAMYSPKLSHWKNLAARDVEPPRLPSRGRFAGCRRRLRVEMSVEVPPKPLKLHRFCIVCTQPIDLKRILRGACTCSSECSRKHKNGIRAFRAETRCRLCGHQKKIRKAPSLCAVCAQVTLESPDILRTIP